MSFHSHVALRYFRSRKGFVSVVAGFSLFGILLGVAALIVVMSVMNGFRSELSGRILGMSGHATVRVPYMDETQANALAKRLLDVPQVTHAEVFAQGQALVMNRGAASGVLLRSVQPEGSSAYIHQSGQILAGQLESLKQENTIAIGKDLARTLQAGLGSVVTLVAPSGSTTPFGFIPRMMKVKVVAVFDVGMNLYNAGWIYSSTATAQKFLKLEGAVTGVELKVQNPMKIDEDKMQIAKQLSGEDAFILTWKDSNQQFFEALEVEQVSMFIILTLIVVVAAFNIVTGQTMSVNDKRGDIAILRTMGARRRDILKIFILGGSMIGLLGTALGVLFGFLIVFNLQTIVSFLERVFGVSIFSGEAYFLDKIPAVMNPTEIAVIIGVSLLLSVLAAVYPALRAARLDPVEVLRSE